MPPRTRLRPRLEDQTDDGCCEREAACETASDEQSLQSVVDASSLHGVSLADVSALQQRLRHEVGDWNRAMPSDWPTINPQ